MTISQAELFKILGVENRIQIIQLLKEKGPLGVNELSGALGVTPSAISQHLKILKHAGLVRNERKGYWIPYEVNPEALEQCQDEVVTSTLYLGVAYDGGESMISGKYWLGSSLPSGIINPPEVGVKFPYAGQPTFGVAAGCLAGCTITDPIAGVFETILATGCFDSSGYTWSRTLEYSLRMYEWRC